MEGVPVADLAGERLGRDEQQTQARSSFVARRVQIARDAFQPSRVRGGVPGVGVDAELVASAELVAEKAEERLDDDGEPGLVPRRAHRRRRAHIFHEWR